MRMTISTPTTLPAPARPARSSRPQSSRPQARARGEGGVVTRIPIPRARADAWDDADTTRIPTMMPTTHHSAALPPLPRPVAPPRSRPGQRNGQAHGGTGAIVTRLDPSDPYSAGGNAMAE